MHSTLLHACAAATFELTLLRVPRPQMVKFSLTGDYDESDLPGAAKLLQVVLQVGRACMWQRVPHAHNSVRHTHVATLMCMLRATDAGTDTPPQTCRGTVDAWVAPYARTCAWLEWDYQVFH